MSVNGRRRRSLRTGGAAAIVAVATAVACDNAMSRSPIAPTVPSVAAMEISGPESVAPGQTVLFSAQLRLSDGTLKQPQPGMVRWLGTSTILEVSDDGAATGRLVGETLILAELSGTTGVTLPLAFREVVVVPEGTFRLGGRIVEEGSGGAAVRAARVEVVGEPLQSVTDASGEYRRFGVPGHAEIRVTAAGYRDHVEAVHLTTHGTRQFSLAFSGLRLQIEGDYRLAVDVDDCSGASSLPSELQHRVYDAQVRQTGGELEVLLTEPRFRVVGGEGNHFRGRVDATGVRLSLQSFFNEIRPVYPDLVEQLSDGSVLIIGGDADLRGTPSLLTGNLQGELSIWDSAFPFGSVLSGCFAPGQSSVRMTMSRR